MKLIQALRRVARREQLQRAEAREVFAAALGGESDPVQLAGLLVALSQRGETPDELLGAVDALRGAMLPFAHDFPDAIDTCGTGGDGHETFNISTAAAIVACAAGAKVIKHGNRSVSSRCGSADLLEAAGVVLDLTPERARRVLEETGITFLFAPHYHPAMRHAASVRNRLGVRTLFNWLGPLCNPGGVRRQLLGVHAAQHAAMFAEVLEELGHERAFVVCGAGDADELTLEAGNLALAVGSAPQLEVQLEACGLTPAPLDALRGGSTPRNLQLLRLVLEGEPSPITDAVLLNAGAALVAGGRTDSLPEAVARCREALASGRAARRFDAWIDATRGARGGAA